VLVGLKIITILLHAEDALQKLQEKHPAASGRLDDLPDINPESALSVTEIEVRQAVLSFPAGSLGGPDGMRPQHLKDMMLCRESGTDVLAALTGFTNVVLAGLCPKEATLFFFGGRLLAMNKKSGGIGLIAVGLTLRRLASNVAILAARHAWLLVWPSTAQSRHSRGQRGSHPLCSPLPSKFGPAYHGQTRFCQRLQQFAWLTLLSETAYPRVVCVLPLIVLTTIML